LIKKLVDAVNEHGEKASRGEVRIQDKFESEFFICQMFKKGTLHITFKDEKLYLRFNRIAAEGRGWLKAWQGKYTKATDIVSF
jgi:hypothetical protein